jgi:hypothetical protein
MATLYGKEMYKIPLENTEGINSTNWVTKVILLPGKGDSVVWWQLGSLVLPESLPGYTKEFSWLSSHGAWEHVKTRVGNYVS